MNELTTPLDTLCDELNVDLDALMDKVVSGLQGVSISHFTDDELKVIQTALEIAGEF